MKKSRRLKLAKETLQHLGDHRIQGAVGIAVSDESICWCITHLCASEGYTHCEACNS